MTKFSLIEVMGLHFIRQKNVMISELLRLWVLDDFNLKGFVVFEKYTC